MEKRFLDKIIDKWGRIRFYGKCDSKKLIVLTKLAKDKQTISVDKKLI